MLVPVSRTLPYEGFYTWSAIRIFPPFSDRWVPASRCSQVIREFDTVVTPLFFLLHVGQRFFLGTLEKSVRLVDPKNDLLNRLL